MVSGHEVVPPEARTTWLGTQAGIQARAGVLGRVYRGGGAAWVFIKSPSQDSHSQDD